VKQVLNSEAQDKSQYVLVCLYWCSHSNLQKSWESQAVSKVSGQRQMTDIWFVVETVIFILTTKSTWTQGSTSFQQKGYQRDKQIWACIWLTNFHQIQRSKNVPSVISMPPQFLHGIVFLQKCKITFILHPCQFKFCHNMTDIPKWKLCYLRYGKNHQHTVECV
jgi:hypothetical protein